ncbi:S1 family peptidase [Aliiroseovarius sp. F20344]|uniref:S1 family peptidase n=1 Tax=Aliiroseovarius sp. F20344 TaxID=2926414 RepID=UPI001FF4E920|nr:S1 family peptidase [Aliiroseovarius sp. F20344]MCK0142780.1 S1 family peptidase [Aliiroseovarius sp. F20344]
MALTTVDQAQALTTSAPVSDGNLEAVGQTIEGNCTATLIASDMALTAIHCYRGAPPGRTGIQLHNVFPNGQSTRSTVKIPGTVRYHPEFENRGWLREDVAIIDLDFPVHNVAASVVPIPIEFPSVTPLTGDALTLVGYGATGSHCNQPPQGKRQLTLSVTQANYAAIHFDYPGYSTCPGDSGGPLLNSRGRVVGVASHAANPGEPARHSWYRPTAYSYNWIFRLPQRGWANCQWVAVENGGINSHAQGGAWCPVGSYMVQMDLDGPRNLHAHDAPVVGQVQCCGIRNSSASWGSCTWVEVQRRGVNSHGKRPDWCPDGHYLTALDLDGDRAYSANDTPVVGAAQCCRPADAGAQQWGSMYWIEVEAPTQLDARRLDSHSPHTETWCLDGAFMTQIDLDGDRGRSDHDAPVAGAVKCARPRP